MSLRRNITGLLLWLPTVLASVAAAHAQTGIVTYVYNFTNGADGGSPIGGVVQDKAGTLYGETSTGGAVPCTSKAGRPAKGCGTVYSFTPTAGLKVLASFSGPNGAYGMNTLTLIGSTLYGTTANGGTKDDGVVFSIKTDGTGFTLLHQFSGTDGAEPASILRVGPTGVIYGVTKLGGTKNKGVLFSLKLDGTYAVLHNFVGGNDGNYPYTLLMTSSQLVGSTSQGGGADPLCSAGCGTLFTYVFATGTYSVPFTFSGAGGYGGAIGSIGAGSTVFGNGGSAPYSLSKAAGLVDFPGFGPVFTGVAQSGPLLAPNGTLYGVTGPGPISSGTVYSVANGVTTILAGLSYPVAQPILLSSGTLVGTATSGGACGYCGTIWEYTP